MAISSSGIGSNLPIEDIITKLMTAEAAPLTTLSKKEASYQAKLSAYGSLRGSLASFQASLNALSSPAKYQSFSNTIADTTIFSATSTNKAAAGAYSVNVTRLAQAQSIVSAGYASSSATIGSGISSTISFQFGTISGGTYGTASASGTSLPAGFATSGMAANSLILNGTTITTGAGTNSAKALSDAINAKTATTGVTATAQTDTGALGSDFVATIANGYQLVIGGITIVPPSIGSVGKADIDAALAASNTALSSAGITLSGTAAGGDLRLTRADGANIAIDETLGAADSGGFFHAAGTTTSKTYTGTIGLTASSAITISGTNPAAAGLTAGNVPNGIYKDASYTQNSSLPTGTITIDNTNNSLEGIRDAINKGGFGVTASIVSDGSNKPNHLVLTSDKTGASSSMKIAVTGDAALAELMGYDPAGNAGQKMTQTSAAQSTELTVNGIAVTGTTNTIVDAVPGVSLNLSKVGTTTMTVARDTASVTSSVNTFVKAYNDLNTTLKSLTSYNATTKAGGLLLGDSATRQVQSDIRRTMSTVLKGLEGSGLNSLQQLGVTISKEGTMSVDSTRLQKAISNNFNDIAGLFATMGNATDGLVSYIGSTAATVPGVNSINIKTIATQGKLLGSTALGGTVITAGVNDELILTVDGADATIKLAAGTYNAEALMAQIQSSINGVSALSSAGIAVSVSTDTNGYLNIVSNRYGSASIVTGSGSAAVDLFGTVSSVDGKDVAGTIDGVEATGSGQTLTGMKGSPTEGLQILINGGATGDRGTLNFSQGYAYLLSKQIDGFIGSSGLIAGRTDGINSSIKALGTSRTEMSKRLTQIEARYRKEFGALDSIISKMNSTSAFLTQQLAQISNLSSQN